MIPLPFPASWRQLSLRIWSIPDHEAERLPLLSSYYLQEILLEADPQLVIPRFRHPMARQIAQALQLHSRQLLGFMRDRKPLYLPDCLPTDSPDSLGLFLNELLKGREALLHPISELGLNYQGPQLTGNLVEEKAPTYNSVIEYLESRYQEAVAKGLNWLKHDFLQDYRRSQYPRYVFGMRVAQVMNLLIPDAQVDLEMGELSRAQVQQLREEARLLSPAYQLTKLLERQSIEEIARRSQPPFFQVEAYLQFINWLHEENFEGPEAEQLLQSFAPKKSSRIPWRSPDPEPELSLLFRDLGEYLPEELGFEDFQAHFQYHGQPKIQWRGPQTLLAYLFEQLRAASIIPDFSQKGMAELIAEHFLNKSGENLNPKSLEVSFSRADTVPRGHQLIDDILSSLRAFRS